MPRTTKEWIGRNDDAMPPRSVFDRLYDKQDGKDAITGQPFKPGDKIVRDHIVPLADGGENRESNLQLITEETHKYKTKAEATQRAKTRRLHEQHRGYVRTASQWSTRPLGTGNKQHRATRELSPKFEGDILSLRTRKETV
jgi:5-methylcytosine-specific restriction endonuclease McrA